MTIGNMLKQWLTRLEWFDTLFPRIPVPVQQEIEFRMRQKYGFKARDDLMDDGFNGAVAVAARRSPPPDIVEAVKRSHRSNSRSSSSSEIDNKEKKHDRRHHKKHKHRSSKESSKSREREHRRHHHRSHHKSSSHRNSSVEKKRERRSRSRSVSRKKVRESSP
jgi:hypothetical protein